MTDRKREKNTTLHDKKRNARLNQLRAERVLEKLNVSLQGFNLNGGVYAPIEKDGGK